MSEKNGWSKCLNSTRYQIFAVVKILQRIVVYGSLFLLIAIISGYFAMSLFIAKLDDITSAKQDVYREFRSIQEQNAFLRDDIQNKSEELQAMQDKVSDLEKIVNMRSFVAEENKIEEQEIDLQQLANMQKATILQIIPNGSPVDLFEMKQKAKEKYKKHMLRAYKKYMLLAYIYFIQS